jgi:Family of unknown function (DUF6262)
MSVPATPRTAAAIAGRRRRSQAAVNRVRDAVAALRREQSPVTVAAVARRGAGVSRTFVYDNPRARAAVNAAVADEADQRHTLGSHAADHPHQPGWRERALNAEDALSGAHSEIARQRVRIGELLGQIRDLQAEWDDQSIARITTENATLKQRVRHLTRIRG